MDSTLMKLLLGVGFQADASSIAKVQSDASALKNTLSKMFSVIGITLTLSGVKNFIEDVSSVTAEAKAIQTQFENTFDTVKEVAQESLDSVAERTGISATRMKQTYTQLASYLKTTGMSAQEANDYASEAMYEIANNAAYMDTTLEEAAGYFIKMSKGNFQVDDRMNMDFMQGSRDELAQELYGKNFADLSKHEQEIALLEKVKRANRDMGAIKEENGEIVYAQAAFEADQYTNQVGELSDALKQLKVSIGGIFLTPLLRVQTKLAEVAHDMAEALGDIDDEGSLVYRLSTKLTNVVEKGIGYVDKVISGIKRLIDLMGGLEGTLQVLSIVVGVISSYMIASKILSVAKALANVNWKLVGILAIATLIWLIVDDFFGFLNGKDSVIGRFLGGFGIELSDVKDGIQALKDEARAIWDYVSPYLQDLKEDVGELYQHFSEAMNGLGEVFGKFWDEHGDQIQKALEILKDWVAECAKFKFDNLISGIESLIESFGRFLDIITKITQGDFKGAIESAVGAVSSRIDSDVALADASNPVGGLMQKGIGFVNDKTGLNLPTSYSDAWNKAKDAMKDFGISAESISDGVMAAKDSYDELKAASEENAQRIMDGANAAEEGANQASTAISGMKSNVESDMTYLGSNSYTWGYDMGANFASGIQQSPITAALNNIATATKDVLGHSKPKKGPLSDDDKWMPDMMQNFIKGINSQKGQLKTAVAGIADTIKGNEDGLMALGQPASAGMAAGSSKNINVTQNISYANTFNGDTRANQVRAAGAMSNSARDTTSYLANAIAFGR